MHSVPSQNFSPLAKVSKVVAGKVPLKPLDEAEGCSAYRILRRTIYAAPDDTYLASLRFRINVQRVCNVAHEDQPVCTE